MYVGDHIADLRIGNQKFANNVDVVACKNLVDLCQYTRYVRMDMDNTVSAIVTRGLQIGEVAAHMRFAFIHKPDDAFWYKVDIAGVIFRVIENNDPVFAGSFRQTPPGNAT